MGSTSKNLFHEFNSVSQAEWEAKLEKDLRGKGLESLRFKPEFDLNAKANYHSEEFTNQAYSKGDQLNANNNDWAITQSFEDTNSKQTNKEILKALNEGVSGIKVYLTRNTNYIELFNGVLLEHIFSHVVCQSSANYQELIAFLETENTKLSIIEMPFLTYGLDKGTFSLNQLEIDNFITESAKYCVKNIVVDGHSYCQFGASTAQELGIALSMLNETVQRLVNQGIDGKFWHQKVAMHLGVTDNYFVNIAKFRAVKELVLQLKSQWSLSIDTLPWVSAETVERHMALNDRYNNVLRHTSSAMSAVLGGVSQLVVKPYSEVTGNDKELSLRLAKNIQLILKDESYFHEVIDPSSGSYVIESLTDQLIEKAWQYFMDIEAEGGYYKSVEKGYIQSLVELSKNAQTKALNNGSKTLLGVNKFQNSNEIWQSSQKVSSSENIDFKRFSVFNLEANFEKQKV